MINKTSPLIAEKILSPAAAKIRIDTYIEALLKERADQATGISVHYAAAWQTISTLYQGGGKRLRPYMTLLTYQAFSNESSEAIIPAAAAQELLHQSMLIHDDIIDRDLIRYGIRNVTGQFYDYYEHLIPEPTERRHFAESAALLAGDLVLSEAYYQITQSKVPAETIIIAQRLLSESIFHVAGGELLDTEASFRPRRDIDPLTIAAQKTASYSFVGPLVMGATLAHAPEEQIALLRDLGNTVGIAFQLRDDIIGIFGDEAVTGKSTTGDICEGKQTLLIDEFYKRASPEQQTQFEAVFGKADASNEQVQAARDLLIESGTLAAIEAYIANYETACIEKLEALQIDSSHKTIFAELVTQSLKREK